MSIYKNNVRSNVKIGYSLPTNSDVVLFLSQYLNCLEKLGADNIMSSPGGWVWKKADGTKSDIRTAPLTYYFIVTIHMYKILIMCKYTNGGYI